MASSEDVPAGDVGTGRRISFATGLFAFLLLVVTFAAGGLYLSTEVRIQRVAADAATERATTERRAAAEREALLARASADAATQTAELLKMAALPLSWAVRQDLQEKGYREIALYFQQLAGVAGVQRIVLVSHDGSVKVASDKKLEGRSAAEAFPGVALEDASVAVRSTGTQGLVAIVPIMGLNTRLGTLIVDYKPPSVDQRPAP